MEELRNGVNSQSNKIGIVTVLYNSSKVLGDYYRTLESQTFRDFALYVVDNASQDNSLALARRYSEDVSFKTVILPQENNYGIAKGNNIGISYAINDGCDYVLLSNNDVILDKEDCLSTLLKRAEVCKSDIIVPKIYFYSDSQIIWAAGGNFSKSFTSTTHYGLNQTDNGQYNVERPIRYTPTCFVLIKSDVFERIGLMDEKYFVYYDDTDFMYRAWKSDCKMIYTPATSLLHNESTCTGKGSVFKRYYLSRNQLYFIWKNLGWPMLYFWVVRRLIVCLLYHSWNISMIEFKAEVRGLRDGVKMCHR